MKVSELNFEQYETWLPLNKKRIQIDGKPYKISVSIYNAIYPYEHKAVSIYANGIGHDSCYDLASSELGWRIYERNSKCIPQNPLK